MSRHPGRRGVTRRGFLAGLAAVGSGVTASAYPGSRSARADVTGTSLSADLSGAGQTLPGLERYADLAVEIGGGEPVCFVDLDAVDANLEHLVRFAVDNGWHVRPSLKSCQSPKFCAYLLERLAEPRGMIFHLRHVAPIVSEAPAGVDLLTGYVPTVGELATYLSQPPPAGEYRLRVTVDSLELLEHTITLARDSTHPGPLELCFELDAGTGRGGFTDADDMVAAAALLRDHRELVQLTALLCYDGHATLSSANALRRTFASDAQRRLAHLHDTLRDAAGEAIVELEINGPGSSNYVHWVGDELLTEISPGSALLYAGYLRAGFDDDELQLGCILAAPVLRVVGPFPRIPLTAIPLPGANREQLMLKGGGWPTASGRQPSRCLTPSRHACHRLCGMRAL